MNSSDSSFGSSQKSGDQQQPTGAETGVFWITAVRCIFPLLVCASLSLGCQVPLLYDLSGAEQSHTPAIVGYIFAGFLIACCISLLALPLLPKLKREEPVRNPLIQPFRFPVVVIIPAMLIAGMFVFRDATMIIIGATSFIYPALCAVRLGVASRSLRWRIVSLYSCMYLPFLWVFANDVFQNALKQGSWDFLPLLAGAPALLSFLFISRFYGGERALMMLSPVIIAGLEALLGLWIVQLGARRAIAYLILLFAVSVITSFGFHALLRA